MKYLITGATGFIGGAVLRQCLLQGREVAVYARRHAPPFWNPSIPWFTGSFENIPQLIHTIQTFKPDWIIQCAGAGSVPFSVEHPAEDFKSSAALVQSLLEAVRISGVPSRIALMSSAALYGNPTTIPVVEDAAIQPLSPYGWNRFVSEQLLHSYGQTYGIESITCRIFSAYGEHLRKQVVYDSFLKTAWSNSDECVFHGTGNETRDFIHADDLSRAVLALCENNSRGTFNLASGIQTKIVDLINMIHGITHSKKTISFTGENRPGDPLYWQADISRFHEIGFNPSIALEEGLDRVWKWIQTERQASQPTNF